MARSTELNPLVTAVLIAEKATNKSALVVDITPLHIVAISKTFEIGEVEVTTYDVRVLNSNVKGAAGDNGGAAGVAGNNVVLVVVYGGYVLASA